MAYRTAPDPARTTMPPGIPYIIGNEAAERFSFYGMRMILVVYMTKYLWLMNDTPGNPLSRAEANENAHLFMMAVYFTPLLGGLLSDAFLGKYRTIILLSLVYCSGHAALALMGLQGDAAWWLFAGLALISLGSGGIKPCVSAHVGDQFGVGNGLLITKVFNYFYLSINLGAFISTLLTPWLLQWYGPHLAFGTPGVLMAIATITFWAGRKKFVHVPAAGTSFLRELFHRESLGIIGKLAVLFLFVSVFWALFDQHGTSWIFQAQDMDRHFLGINWLESQIGAINPILIIVLVPVFTLVIYPAVGKVVTLTPLRKIGAGLFLTTTSFALVAVIQTWIDNGARPNISWQLFAFFLLTAAEVMVSIVSLEFAYTQAPRALKSVVMSLYLLSVSFGNFIAAQVNHLIQIEAPKPPAGEQRVHPGYDRSLGTKDDLLFSLEGEIGSATAEVLARAGRIIEREVEARGGRFPGNEEGQAALAELEDAWGNPLRYRLRNSITARISSDGPDEEEKTKWDLGVILKLPEPEPEDKEGWTKILHPETSWLDRRRKELNLEPERPDAQGGRLVTREWYAGGQVLLEGASYFWFFTWLMLGTAVVFVPFACLYRGKTILQE